MFFCRSSTSSATRWLWRHSAPSDWLRPLLSHLLLMPRGSRDTTGGVRHGFVMTWTNLWAWVPVCAATVCARLVLGGHAYHISQCMHTHTPTCTRTHRELYALVQRKKKANVSNCTTFSCSVSVCWTVMWLLYSNLFRYALCPECCLPLKSGCILEIIMWTFIFDYAPENFGLHSQIWCYFRQWNFNLFIKLGASLGSVLRAFRISAQWPRKQRLEPVENSQLAQIWPF